MENPSSWTLAEYVVDEVLQRYYAVREDGDILCGWSLAMQITNALRAEGLLAPYEAPEVSHLTVHPEPAKFGPES